MLHLMKLPCIANSDSAPGQRTLAAASLIDASGMSIERCLAFCDSDPSGSEYTATMQSNIPALQSQITRRSHKVAIPSLAQAMLPKHAEARPV
ncbi:hypothetical protein H0H93_010632 [Arthromyces matolae]|nr:hypothetical protein H0H93_010632 [Arthromyces matolae]